MASITIRNLDDGLKQRAAAPRAMDGPWRTRRATFCVRRSRRKARGLAIWPRTIRQRVAALGGVELEIAPREPIREAPVLGE
jgi:plasmid stability protein